jgi:hypothetical protein
MKLTAEFDPDFVATPRPKCRGIRVWRLVILCAPLTALALALASTNPAPGSPIAQPRVPAPRRPNPASPHGGPVTPLRLTAVAGGHFVWVASPAIDPNMVHVAPEGIDEAMVLPARDSEAAR